LKTGIRAEDTVAFSFEENSPGTFRLVVQRPLPAGEYVFMTPAVVSIQLTGTTGKVWDFGVDK
jgi:hypothetical protein